MIERGHLRAYQRAQQIGTKAIQEGHRKDAEMALKQMSIVEELEALRKQRQGEYGVPDIELPQVNIDPAQTLRKNRYKGGHRKFDVVNVNGPILRRFREDAQLTQQELADTLVPPIHRGTLVRIENDPFARTTRPMAEKLAGALGVSVTEFIVPPKA